MVKINWYFDRNKITKKKISYIEKFANLNLSEYINKISNQTFI